LSDDTLARLWTAESAGATERHPAYPHLQDCAACRDRFTAFGTWMAEVADVLRDEADELLTPERLAAQQAQIARRLEAIDRPARVIAFPKAARAVINGHSHVRRWVTVAAAASLILGFGLGQVVPIHTIRRPLVPVEAPLTLPAAAQRAVDISPVVESISDDELFSDVFTRSHVATLSALDDMTPHARDTVLNRRNSK
jgi:hypothetical protein